MALCVWIGSASFIHAFSTSTPRSRVFVGTPAKSPHRCVGDCMSSYPFTLRTNDSVDEAIASLLRLGVSGAPVVDGDGTLVGVISTSDFLHKELGGALLPMEGSSEQVMGYLDAAQKIIGQKVGDMMTQNPVTISPNESMKDAAAVMAKSKLHRVIVIDEEEQLVGVLTRSDIMRDVLTTVRGALPEADDSSGSDAVAEPAP